MKIIAHGIRNKFEAKKAFKAGVDFIEIDVSKKLFFGKFTAQHNGLLGILGIGPILENLLTAEIRSRTFFDLKPISYRNSFTHKLTLLLLKFGVKDAKICGHDWQMLSDLSDDINAKPYYTLKNSESIKKFKRMFTYLKKPVGLSVNHKLIDKKFMKEFKKKSVQIWAWTVNDLAELKRLKKLGVDGIITDNWLRLHH